MEVLHEAPDRSNYTSVPEHHSQTPESFFDGPPVLFHQSPSATLRIRSSDLANAPAFSNIFSRGEPIYTPDDVIVNGNDEVVDRGDVEIEVAGVDVWVTSEFVKPPWKQIPK